MIRPRGLPKHLLPSLTNVKDGARPMDEQPEEKIDMILKKTEEEIIRKDFDPKKTGIPVDSFLKEWDKRGKSWKKNM